MSTLSDCNLRDITACYLLKQQPLFKSSPNSLRRSLKDTLVLYVIINNGGNII
jgi:hypothetical protein